jgi:alkylhydroperoxidase/carboxymuconolactone decarboxylase family protein YurZ
MDHDAKHAQELKEFLERMDREGGIEQLRSVAQIDLQYAKAQHELFRAAAYTDKVGGLSRREKELIWLAVECAYQMNTEWLRLHMRAALEAGATPLQVLEAMEVASIPRGFPSVSVALDIFKEVTGTKAKHKS